MARFSPNIDTDNNLERINNEILQITNTIGYGKLEGKKQFEVINQTSLTKND